PAPVYPLAAVGPRVGGAGAGAGHRPGPGRVDVRKAAKPATKLLTYPNFHDDGDRGLWHYTRGDEFYEMLIDAHRDLDEAGSAMLNSKLVLLLANHVGDLGVLREAIAAARAGIEPVDTGETSRGDGS